jgi:ParB family chromosome partitioning protein
MAGFRELPVVIRECDDLEAAQISLIENLQREDLNAIEEAEGYRQLMQEFGLTQEQVAKKVGKARPTVANAMRLMLLPEPVVELVREGRLSPGHARALIPLEGRAAEASEAVIRKELSVRETEKLVKKLLTAAPVFEDRKNGPCEVDYFSEMEKQLSSALSRRVTFSAAGKKERSKSSITVRRTLKFWWKSCIVYKGLRAAARKKPF